MTILPPDCGVFPATRYHATVDFPRRAFLAAPALLANAATVSLTAAEANWLDAICEQIVPSDEDPGARQAGVVNYIDRQLAGPLQRFRKAYQDGLADFMRRKPDFLELSFEAQTEHLKSIETTPFFLMVVDHTMQGFYGDPKHGGNRDRVSWKMMKIDRYMDHGPWHNRTHEIE